MKSCSRPRFTQPMLDSVMKARGGTTPQRRPTAPPCAPASLRIVARMVGRTGRRMPATRARRSATTSPSIRRSGLPAAHARATACCSTSAIRRIRVVIDAASDSNFSYWHSATFNNDGTKVLFTDEWGGGGQPKCRATDQKEWGADAIFTIEHGKLHFQSYYKMPAPQTTFENCVAHNGSLIPIPGRDVMVQSWYQGGISVFDWTDAAHPKEIAFFDRGPVDSTRMANGGSWSVYWYNGVMVSSEISRGLDIVELTPSAFISQNEIDAAKTVHVGLPEHAGTAEDRVAAELRAGAARTSISSSVRTDFRATASRLCARRCKSAQGASGSARRDALTQLATQIDGDAGGSSDSAKVQKLSASVKALAGAE